MRQKPLELWLIWQNVETRQRYHIGRLLYKEGVYTFLYETNGYRRKLADAMDNGYQPHFAFPDTDKVYTSKTLFGPFARRLPDSRRPDYLSVLRDLGLTYENDQLSVLLATGGILATDSYEFVAPIVIEDTDFALDFFVAGWRYYNGEQVIDQLRIGDSIEFSLDPDNLQDPKAVIVTLENGKKLGFIPAFYSGWMFEIVTKKCSYQAKIRAIHPDAVPHRKVSIEICGEVHSLSDIQDMLSDKEELLLIMR